MSASRGRVVAIAGASSLLGTELLRVLEERPFGVVELRPLADAFELEAQAPAKEGSRSEAEPNDELGARRKAEGPTEGGSTAIPLKRHVEFMDEEIPIQVASPESFDGCDAVFLAGTPEQAGRLAKLSFLRTRCTVDLSGRFADDADVPLMLAEINEAAVAGLPERSLVAVPDAATSILVLALAPIHRLARIRHAHVSTYESVSGLGRAGMDELGRQIRELFNYQPIESDMFPRPIAFNCVPQVDEFEANGYTRAEMTLSRGVARLLDAPPPVVDVTRVWVPVFSGHSASIGLELEKSVTIEEIRAALEGARGVELVDDPAEEEYPVNGDTIGGDRVAVGRLRLSAPEGGPTRLSMWIAADNVRRGAALAGIDLAEAVLARGAAGISDKPAEVREGVRGNSLEKPEGRTDPRGSPKGRTGVE